MSLRYVAAAFLSFVLALAAVCPTLADTVDLRSGDSVCKVDIEHGARIISWEVHGEEMLWNPSVPQKDDGKWRHGGVPIVWPWQGDEYPDGVTNGPLHGVAWLSPFKVESRRKIRGGEALDLSLEACGLRADYTIALENSRLQFRFNTTNIGKEPRNFAMSIHPYFLLQERDRTVMRGLDGIRYRDALKGSGTNGVWKGELPITSWMDYEFFRGTAPLFSLIAESGTVRLVVRSPEAAAYWVWNPGERWAENGAGLYGELPDDAWRHILSVEPSTAGMRSAIPLRPGESRALTAEFARVHSL